MLKNISFTFIYSTNTHYAALLARTALIQIQIALWEWFVIVARAICIKQVMQIVSSGLFKYWLIWSSSKIWTRDPETLPYLAFPCILFWTSSHYFEHVTPSSWTSQIVYPKIMTNIFIYSNRVTYQQHRLIAHTVLLLCVCIFKVCVCGLHYSCLRSLIPLSVCEASRTARSPAWPPPLTPPQTRFSSTISTTCGLLWLLLKVLWEITKRNQCVLQWMMDNEKLENHI